MKRVGIQICLITLTLFVVVISNGQPTNPTALTAQQSNDYRLRANKLMADYNSDSSTNSQDRLFEGGRALQKDYPTRSNGYQAMICAIEDCADKNPTKAQVWAKEMIDENAPERFNLWCKGFLFRVDSQGKTDNNEIYSRRWPRS
jgi:hypothetical protein